MKRTASMTTQKRSYDVKDWLVLGAGGLLFSMISLGNMARWSVWFDEAYGVYITRFNFLEIARYTAADVHPPLYYWLLKAWQAAFGNSELALRSMSLFFMIVAMVIVYALIRKLFSRRAATLTMLFMVVSPMMVRYSEEARMYGLIMAIVAAATYLLVSAMEAPSRRKWLAYAVLIALGMWTHYFTALVWITHWLWRWYVLRKGTVRQTARRFFSKAWVLTHVAAIGLYLPWLPFMIKQLTSVQGGGFWIGPVTTMSPINFFSSVLAYVEHWEVQHWLALGVIVCIILATVLTIRTYIQIESSLKHAYVLLILMAIAPMTILLLLSMPPLRPMFIDRYLMGSIPFIAALLAATIVLQYRAHRSFVLPATLGGLVLILGMSGIIRVYEIGNLNKVNRDSLPIRQVVDAIQKQACPGQPILTDSPTRFYELHYYDSRRAPVYFIAADSIPWGSYDMLRYSDYRKVRDTVAFAKKHGGTIWFAGDWEKGRPVLPKQGKWEILGEIAAPNTSDKSMLRAVKIKLQ